MTAEQAIESLRRKFTSNNDVPVTRAPITREEYEAIRAAIAAATGEPE